MEDYIKRLIETQPPLFLHIHNRPTEEEVKKKQEEMGEEWIVIKGCGKFLIRENTKL